MYTNTLHKGDDDDDDDDNNNNCYVIKKIHRLLNNLVVYRSLC